MPHKNCFITAIGIRNPETGQELPVSWEDTEKACTTGIPPGVQTFPLGSFDHIMATFEKLDPLHQEGYVVVDANFNRVKVKHPSYVAIHHLRDSFGPKRLLEVIRTGEAPELLTYYPEWTEHFNGIQAKYNALVSDLEADYAKIQHIETQKDFALQAVKSRCSGALFRLRAKQIANVKEHLAGISIDNLLRLLDIKGEEE